MKVFLWSIIQGVLLLDENLQKRGIQNEIRCPKCQDKETSMHIFFICPFAAKVRKMILLNRVVVLATEDDFKKVIVYFRDRRCLPPTGVSNSILPWVCWSIWLACNSMVFETKLANPTDIAARALRLVREWTTAQDHKPKANRGLPHARRMRDAATTTKSETICKTDAA